MNYAGHPLWQVHGALLRALLGQRTVAATLLVALVAIVASAALAYGAHRHRSGLQHEAEALRAALVADRQTHPVDARAQAERFQRLQARGFARGDAVAWVEALLAAVEELHLAPPRFEVGAQRPLEAATHEAGEHGTSLMMQQLRFALTGLHEEEFVHLLQRLRALAPADFAVRQCRLTRSATGSGLTAECELQWLVLADTAADRAAGRQP